MLDLSGIDVEEIASALADQTDYEHRWLLDPRTGQVAFWTSDTGIDGENPIEIDELDLIPIDPLPSHIWYQDMADFADGLSDRAAGRRLASALQGRGAFRRFKNQLYEQMPELISPWHTFREVRAQRRAVDWLLDEGLIDANAAEVRGRPPRPRTALTARKLLRRMLQGEPVPSPPDSLAVKGFALSGQPQKIGSPLLSM